jgi:hypothetical protein
MVAFATQAPASLATTEVLGLLTACPWTQSNPPDCRLHEIRKLPLSELYAMVRHASADDLAEFAQTCDSCPHRCPACDRW